MLENDNRRTFFPTIEGMVVDCEGLLSLSHQCIPDHCPISKCCCSRYEIGIDEKELSRIIGILPEASNYSNLLTVHDCFDNFFEDEGRALYTIEKDDEGHCVLGYQHNKSFLCSLHSVALELNMPVHSVKPMACMLWPLALVESDPMVLSIQDDILGFPCNQKREADMTHLDNGIEEIVEAVFGLSFLSQIQKAIELKEISS